LQSCPSFFSESSGLLPVPSSLCILQLDRNIAAVGFLGQIIAADGVRPGPTAAADLEILTLAAVVFIGFEIPEAEQQFGVFPNFLESEFKDVAG
jgi:hypothetical protein